MVTKADGALLALDAKMSFDDNAMFRRRNIADMHDPSQGDPREAQAAEHNLSYIGLEGEIGCIVNGAGLAMATMDMIKHAGGEPANFLDIGGGATPRARGQGLPPGSLGPQRQGDPGEYLRRHQPLRLGRRGHRFRPAKEVKIDVPLIVRLAGTNVEAGKKILAESGLDLITADSLSDAATKAVAAWQRRQAQPLRRGEDTS